MKIVHICLGCFFPDGHSYQENMLPKYHKELGYEVEVIASLLTFNKNGNAVNLEKGSSYINENAIQVTRLDYKIPVHMYKKLKRYVGLYSALEKSNPDILFIHGCQFLDMNIIVKYLKNSKYIRVYVDNHADFSNSARNWLSKNILHKLIWKRQAQLIEPYVTKFYGVLPARVDFMQKIYRLPSSKCELLIMGADDTKVNEANSLDVKKRIRSQYNIEMEDLLIVTGGKIDKFKTQTILLMQAIRKLKKLSVKLIVFGSVTEELMEQVDFWTDGIKVQYIGWIKAEETYKYFAAADLVAFPGRHSVFWEQVVAQGIPMVCKYWSGTTHIDIGGNVKYINEDSVEEISSIIEKLADNKNELLEMKNIAKSDKKNEFLYSSIAKKSLIN